LLSGTTSLDEPPPPPLHEDKKNRTIVNLNGI